MGDKNVSIEPWLEGLGGDYSWRKGGMEWGLVISESQFCALSSHLCQSKRRPELWPPPWLSLLARCTCVSCSTPDILQPVLIPSYSRSPTSYILSAQRFKVKGLISVILYYCPITL